MLKAVFVQANRPLHAIRRITRRNAPPSLPEKVWANRGGQAWLERYWNDHHAPRRDMIIDAIRAHFGSPDSVLDVGCNTGPNLRRMLEEFPSAKLAGFDINSEAIAFARERLDAELRVASFSSYLLSAPSDSVDLVISSFALAYSPPSQIAAVLADLVRVARRGLVLAEPYPFDRARPEGLLSDMPDWRHDYAKILAYVAPGAEVSIQDLPTPGHRDSGLVTAILRAG